MGLISNNCRHVLPWCLFVSLFICPSVPVIRHFFVVREKGSKKALSIICSLTNRNANTFKLIIIVKRERKKGFSIFTIPRKCISATLCIHNHLFSYTVLQEKSHLLNVFQRNEQYKNTSLPIITEIHK